MEGASTTPAAGTGKMASAGKPQTANFRSPLAGNEGQDGAAAAAAGNEGGAALTPEQQKEANIAAGLNEDGTAKVIELTAEKKAENLAAGLNEDGTPKKVTSLADATDDELKAAYEAKFGQKKEPTPEEITAAEKALDKRMLDIYVDAGGTIEQYSLLKSYATADLTELSKADLTAELKAAGITDPAHIEAIQKERYYQIEQAEIDKIEDDAEKELAQKKLDFGKKKFEAKGAHKKEQAVQFFNTLKEAIKEQDLQSTKENEFSSNVEEHFKKVERKIALQLGQVNDTNIDPVNFEVPEAAIAKAKEILKTPASRKQLLFTPEGEINLSSLAELVLKSEMFDSAIKTAYLEAGDRQVEEFKKVFPFIDPKAIGVGGSAKTKTGKGNIVKAGPPQKFTPR